ncbi:SpoIIE family protein phosphatase [filamentous cyanobacterium LEGE 11480]|uniref:SpoIIE family protein phosphatase n=1 Tax=Romeriopsis navalis LEGE 11480 TaxID=2777977 RepID=A0A928VRU2_9CYAN|nr:SpoIIE family protein phosphatase [Romeriopsis navalis]MBE9031402.1 SpoIIE family protein phosphatase [Romeriopsis navalis LEGE 11480]
MNLDSQPKLKMLIVDDEPDNLDLLYRTFRLEFQVLRAESAPAALELLDRHGEVAIIISDQRMPEMLGTEFLSRTVERFPDTIRMVLTAYTDVKDLVDAINSGKVFKYITKPWTQQQLQAVVRQAAETYKLVKQRTDKLQQALRRESTFNSVTTAIRESIDYTSMLPTIVQAIGHTFQASCGLLHTVEEGERSPQPLLYASDDCEADLAILNESIMSTIDLVVTDRRTEVQAIEQDNQTWHHLVLPLRYQNDLLAVLNLVRAGTENIWTPADIDLIQGVIEQAALAISQAKLHQQTRQQAQQMRSELAVARQIQSNLLRQNIPEFASAKVQACCHPAREVGGDFFEVYDHPQGDIWVAVGDVSGKGVPAALFMASAISVLRREMAQEISPHPEDVMRSLNQTLMEDLVSTNCFITMVLAKFNPTTGELFYANAGHLYPMIWSAAELSQTEEPEYLMRRGIPLGILPTWKGESGNRMMQSGEFFLLTSDGLTEASIRMPVAVGAANAADDFVQLQQSGLWQLLREQNQEFDLKNLLETIRQHTVAQEDDQTMLSLEVL